VLVLWRLLTFIMELKEVGKPAGFGSRGLGFRHVPFEP
jgi:hypothetical protein